MASESAARQRATPAPNHRSARTADSASPARPPTRADRYAAGAAQPEPTIPRGSYILLALSATLISSILIITLLLIWRPVLSITIVVLAPEAYLLLSRAGGLVAYGLLWLSMALGVSITSKLSRIWPGGPAAVDVHRYVSLLGLGFTLLHVLALLGDTLLDFTLAKGLLPFSGSSYRPFIYGLMGKIGFYLMLIVGLSFYIRARLGHRLWRLIHYLSFISFVLSLTHGVLAGTDSSTSWVRGLYIASVSLLLILTLYRLWLLARTQRPAPAPNQPARKKPPGQPAADAQ